MTDGITSKSHPGGASPAHKHHHHKPHAHGHHHGHHGHKPHAASDKRALNSGKGAPTSVGLPDTSASTAPPTTTPPSTNAPATTTGPAATSGPSETANPAANALGAGPMQGQGLTKDGMTIPNGGEGKGTVFWNGHIPYKGAVDKENMQNGGKGAWGDANAPTDYAVALPVGLNGGGNQWHNQKILITNPQTGKQVVARVQDKGPNPRTGAKIDMTPVVMEGLGVSFKAGSAHVKFEFAPDNAPVGPVH